MDEFIRFLHRRARSAIPGAVLLADRHQKLEVVDEAFRHLWRERDRFVCWHRADGAIDGNEFWLHGEIQLVTAHYETGWVTPGAATIYLQSSVCVLAGAEQCLAGVRDFFYSSVAVFDV